MRGQALLYMLDDSINVAKFEAFLGGEFCCQPIRCSAKRSTSGVAEAFGCGVVEESLSSETTKLRLVFH